jgi:hypothetical protein
MKTSSLSTVHQQELAAMYFDAAPRMERAVVNHNFCTELQSLTNAVKAKLDATSTKDADMLVEKIRHQLSDILTSAVSLDAVNTESCDALLALSSSEALSTASTDYYSKLAQSSRAFFITSSAMHTLNSDIRKFRPREAHRLDKTSKRILNSMKSMASSLQAMNYVGAQKYTEQALGDEKHSLVSEMAASWESIDNRAGGFVHILAGRYVMFTWS